MTVGTLGSKFVLDTQQAAANMVQLGQITQTQADRMVRQVKNVSAAIQSMAKAQQESANAANFHAQQTERAGHAAEHFGFQTAAAKRELLVLAHELSQGNYKQFGGSMLVLAERTNAMELAFSAAGLAIGAVALVVGSAAAAMVLGHMEAEEYRKSIILTGNFAGVTADSLRAMADTAALAAHTTVGKAGDAAQALVGTGRFSADALGAATQATLLMEKVTGGSADEIAKDLAKMTDDVTKWAAEHNKQYHFVSFAQFEHIKNLEDQGKTSEAVAEVLKALNEQMKQVNKSVEESASYYERAADAVSRFWRALKDAGRPETTGDKVANIRAMIGREEEALTFALQHGGSAAEIHGREVAIQKLQQELELLRMKAQAEQSVAAAQSKTRQEDEKRIKALMNPPKEVKGPGYPLTMGPQTFDEMFPAADTNKLLKYQQDNATAQRQFFLQEKKDAEEIARTFEAYKPPKMDALDTAIDKYLKNLPDNAKHAEQLVTGSFTRMEDAIINFAKTGKLSFSDLFSFMAEEYLRNLIRMTERQLFQDEKGNFIGLAGLGSGLSGLFSGVASLFSPHATGLDYVPYDNYPALLHKGERVQTAVAAASDRGRGPSIVVDASIGSVGAGVSMPEMARALAVQRAAIDQAFRRRQLQGLTA